MPPSRTASTGRAHAIASSGTKPNGPPRRADNNASLIVSRTSSSSRLRNRNSSCARFRAALALQPLPFCKPGAVTPRVEEGAALQPSRRGHPESPGPSAGEVQLRSVQSCHGPLATGAKRGPRPGSLLERNGHMRLRFGSLKTGSLPLAPSRYVRSRDPAVKCVAYQKAGERRCDSAARAPLEAALAQYTAGVRKLTAGARALGELAGSHQHDVMPPASIAAAISVRPAHPAR